MRGHAALIVAVLGSITALAQKASDTITVTTTPPGATVEMNRKTIGVTPLTIQIGEYAFNAHKSSLVSKRLAQPVNLHVSLPGFNSQDMTITGQPLEWHSFNGKGHFTYYIIERQDFNFKLDKASAAPKTMSNSDVIDLHRAGFGDELIVEKINATATAFTLETSDMIELRKSGVSDGVIQAMIKKSTAP